MLTKRTILVILVLAFITSVLLPFILREKAESVNSTINIASTLIGSIASLLTLLIALLLFNKFGIETPLLEKNTEIVFLFIEEFKKTGVFIHSNRYSLIIRFHEPYHTAFENYYTDNLLFSREYADALDRLLKISESPFMPKSIYEKAIKLRFTVLAMNVKEEDRNNYATVTVFGQSHDNEKFGRFDTRDMTLFEFLHIIDELKSAITNWIKKNSTYSPDLNI